MPDGSPLPGVNLRQHCLLAEAKCVRSVAPDDPGLKVINYCFHITLHIIKPYNPIGTPLALPLLVIVNFPIERKQKRSPCPDRNTFSLDLPRFSGGIAYPMI